MKKVLSCKYAEIFFHLRRELKEVNRRKNPNRLARIPELCYNMVTLNIV